MAFVSYHVFERNDTYLGIHVRRWTATPVRTFLKASEPFALQIGWTYLGTRTFPDQGGAHANKGYLLTILKHERGLSVTTYSSVNILTSTLVTGVCLGLVVSVAYILGRKQHPSEIANSFFKEAKMSIKEAITDASWFTGLQRQEPLT